MSQSILNRALAAANLINLGYEEARAIEVANDWSRRQAAQSLQNLCETAKSCVLEDRLKKRVDGRKLHVSFHYSMYPMLYLALAERSTERVVYSLIGQQTPEHRSQLNHLAHVFGFHIEFVESNLRMIRELRRALKSSPVVVLVDIPWSKTGSDLDAYYPVQGGKFCGRHSMQRLIDLIDDGYEVVTVEGGERQVTLTSEGGLKLGEAFALLGNSIRNDPAGYERLHQFHKYFDFDRRRDCIVSFEIDGIRYGINTRTMQAWKFPESAILSRQKNIALPRRDIESKYLGGMATDETESILLL